MFVMQMWCTEIGWGRIRDQTASNTHIWPLTFYPKIPKLPPQCLRLPLLQPHSLKWSHEGYGQSLGSFPIQHNDRQFHFSPNSHQSLKFFLHHISFKETANNTTITQKNPHKIQFKLHTGYHELNLNREYPLKLQVQMRPRHNKQI